MRKFGRFSGDGEIEAVVADDANGFVYYADERAGIRKYHADPDHSQAPAELATFGTAGYRGDREGLAIYATGERNGFLVSADQVDGASRFLLYRREGTAADPHDHREVVAVIEPAAVDATDGIEATAAPLGPAFPRGVLVTMNSRGRNFLLFAWDKREDARPAPGVGK